MKFNPVKLVLAILVGIYFLWCAYDPYEPGFLYNVHFLIHEAGHPLFGIFGEFIGVAGGTIMQLLVPAVFFGYFIYHEKFYSACFVLFWLGHSLLYVYVYANDAVVMQLVLNSGLTGSEGSFHDWNYMLSSLGLLNYTTKIAGLIRFLATITTIAAIAGCVRFSIGNEEALGASIED